MRIERLILPALAICLPGLVACGPKDAGRSTTPRTTAPTAAPATDPAVRPGDPGARTAPPANDARRAAPPPAATPSTMRCPTTHGAALQAVIWPPHQAHLRRFINETRLDRVTTSKATPVEVCGARGQVAWLLRARCPDGSPPFTDGATAHRSRKGSVGAGGRCGNVVDLYRVPCANTTYKIYMSLYHCAAGQTFP